MARRESQGLQITLIVFVMLTVVLMVTTIVFWNRSKHLFEQNTALQTENGSLKTTADTALENATLLKVWLGHTGQTNIDEIKVQYERDMSTYARSASEVQRNYKEVPALLFSALQKRNKDISDLREQLRQAQAEFEATRQQLQAAVDEAVRIQAEKDAALLKEREQFAADREQLNRQRTEQVATIEKTRSAFEDLHAKSGQQIQDLQKELRNKDMIIDQRSQEIDEITKTGSFESPDGKVVFVNPRTGMVYINLGSADALTRQVSFGVFAVDVNNVAKEDKKATIEVTQIVDDHLAEARISSDKIDEPVLAGDVIYTPLWNASSALHFALAGTMDMNDDGRDDREQVRRLIQANHGTIDAEEQDGEIRGQITRNTRYLVRGTEPEVGEVGDEKMKVRQDAWTKMINQADQFGVETLSLQQLLDFIGFDGEKRAIPLGAGARAEDFRGDRAARARGSALRQRQPQDVGRTN